MKHPHLAVQLLYKRLYNFFETPNELACFLGLEKEVPILPPPFFKNTKQQEVFNFVQQQKESVFLILHGGIKSGKSYISLYIFLREIITAAENTLWLATGYNLSVLRTNVEQIFAVLGFFEGRQYYYNGSTFQYTIGTKILRLCGANNARSFANIRGCTASGAYANEACLQDTEVLLELLKRVSAPGRRLKIFDTNPDKHKGVESFVYKNFISKKKETGVSCFHFKTSDNETNLPLGYIEEQKKILSVLDQRVFLEGEWVQNTSMLFFPLQKSSMQIEQVVSAPCERLAFFDPATGQGASSSSSALAIVYFLKQEDGSYFFIFEGRLYPGLWADHLEGIASFLKARNVHAFYYESNLIGKGAFEREHRFCEMFGGRVASVHNTKEKIARISSLAPKIEKGELLAAAWGDVAFTEAVRLSELNTKKNLDAADALESAIRLFLQ